MQKKVRVAAAQFEHASGNKPVNIATMERMIREASELGVEVLIFPECCVTGYWFLRNLSHDQLVTLAECVPSGPTSVRLLELSQQYGMSIGAGLVEICPEGQLFNTYLVAMPDGQVVSHRKLHCFVNAAMSSGQSITVFETPHGFKAGLLICYDNNLVENVRLTALAGAEVIFAPHQTGGCASQDPNIMGLVDPSLWHNRHQDSSAIESEFRGDKGRGWLMRWLPSRAHDNGVFYIFSNGVGMDDNEVRTGNAMIIDTYGRVLNETWVANDALVIADLCPGLRVDNTGQRWISARRPELYTNLTIPTGMEVDIRTARFGGKGA